jgi:hypothetical protein
MSPNKLMTGLAVAALTIARVAGGQTSEPVDCSKIPGGAMDHASMDHAAHASQMTKCAGLLPTSSGQAAFATIAEVVRLLRENPRTDWSKVNIEALRQHLIDMDDVIMRAAVAQRSVTGGVELRVTGVGRTAEAIKRIAINHARMLDQGTDYHATAKTVPDGALITVTARDTSNARAVAQVRGLGFAGLLTEGNHHAAHHLALARGDELPHER